MCTQILGSNNFSFKKCKTSSWNSWIDFHFYAISHISKAERCLIVKSNSIINNLTNENATFVSFIALEMWQYFYLNISKAEKLFTVSSNLRIPNLTNEKNPLLLILNH